MQPSCASGAIKVFYDIGGMQCGLAGMPAQMNNNPPGSCGTDMWTGSVNGLDLKFVPPPPTGGTCSSAGRVDKQNVTFSGHPRECHMNNSTSAGCWGNECTPGLPSPFAACIEQSGDVACPSPYTSKNLVGTDVNYTCADCSCTVSATCSGRLTEYTDQSCSMNPTPFPVDGTCFNPNVNPPNTTYHSYKYAGTASNVACNAGQAPAPQNLQLVGEHTVCCTP
jgi:hypothetical protein